MKMMKKITSIEAYIESAEKRKTIRDKIVSHLKERGRSHIGLMRPLFNARHQTLTSALSWLEDRGVVVPIGRKARWTLYRLARNEEERGKYEYYRKWGKDLKALEKAFKVLYEMQWVLEADRLKQIWDEEKRNLDAFREELRLKYGIDV